MNFHFSSVYQPDKALHPSFLESDSQLKRRVSCSAISQMRHGIHVFLKQFTADKKSQLLGYQPDETWHPGFLESDSKLTRRVSCYNISDLATMGEAGNVPEMVPFLKGGQNWIGTGKTLQREQYSN